MKGTFSKSKDRYLLGVCGGLAEHFGINPWIVRVVWALVSLVSIIIPGTILYLILAAIMNKSEE